MRCPTCKQTVAAEDRRYAPFCSQRCKLLDLAKWLDGDYSVPGEPAGEEEIAAELLKRAGREPDEQ
ncbi:MAG: DNA gyrase inhibitor YacG [Deltaproteobacteria bacterium]|nr:DNA gyrase inhibitor YacG [Deltaproteobacteria bacterium]